jgi:hypothetical protein
MKMMIMRGNECKWGTVLEKGNQQKRGREGKGSEG